MAQNSQQGSRIMSLYISWSIVCVALRWTLFELLDVPNENPAGAWVTEVNETSRPLAV